MLIHQYAALLPKWMHTFRRSIERMPEVNHTISCSQSFGCVFLATITESAPAITEFILKTWRKSSLKP